MDTVAAAERLLDLIKLDLYAAVVDAIVFAEQGLGRLKNKLLLTILICVQCDVTREAFLVIAERPYVQVMN